MKLRTKLCLLLTLGCLPFSSPAQTADDPYQALIKRDFGTAMNELAAIEKQIQGAKPEQYPQIEAKLIAVVDSAEATLPGKQFACQMLKTVGSAKCIPAVSKLLTDEKLSHMARFVLVGIKDAAADEALRKGLAQTQGNLRIGIINTIGDRGERSSLPALAGLLNDNDAANARAALNAVGKIGGTHGAALLQSAKPAAALKNDWAHAYLRCADSIAAAGDTTASEKIYGALFEGDYAMAIRAAAFPALTRTQKERAVPLIVKTLSSPEVMLSRAAATAVATVPGNAATRAFAKELSGLAPEGKVVLLQALATRGDAVGLTAAVNKLAGDENAEVRQAAIKALGRLGDASSIPVLMGTLKTEPEALKALVDLQGAGVTEALIQQAQAGDVAVRETTFNVLAQRKQVEALPAFRKAMSDGEPKIRRAAWKTMAAMGAQEDLPPLLEKLVAQKDASERDQIAEAVSEVANRMSDKGARSEPVLAAFAKADGDTKACLLPVLANIGGDKALEAVRGCLSAEGDVRKAALRALAQWSDAGAMPDLLKLAKEEKNKTDQIMALQGYIKMIPSINGSAAKVEAHRNAMELTSRPQEKFLVFSGLSEVRRPEALKLVENYLEDLALQREAYSAYEKIAEAIAGQQPTVAAEALQRVVDKATDNGLKNKAKKALDKIKK